MKRLIIIFYAILLVACGDMSDVSKEFVTDLPLFVAKPENVVILPGYNRVKLTFDRFADSRVSGITVYWNNRKQSEVFEVSNDGKNEIFIEGLSEGAHVFEIVSFSSEGDTSIPVTTSGMVYGESFRKMNTPSIIVSAITARKTTVQIEHSSSYYYKYMELQYTDANGAERNVVVYDSEILLTLEDFVPEGKLKYRSCFLPEELCIDEFYSQWVTIVPEVVPIGQPAEGEGFIFQ